MVVFARTRQQTIDFAKTYRVMAVSTKECKIWLGKETLCGWHGRMEGEVRERVVNDRQITGSCER